MANLDKLHIEKFESANDSRSANNNPLATEAVEVYFSVYQIYLTRASCVPVTASATYSCGMRG